MVLLLCDIVFVHVLVYIFRFRVVSYGLVNVINSVRDNHGHLGIFQYLPLQQK